MKHLLTLLLLIPTLCFAGESLKKTILFTGQYRTQAPSYLLAEEDFSGIKNYRYTATGISGRYGMTRYSDATPDTDDIVNIFPFRKSDGSLKIIVQAEDGTNSYYYDLDPDDNTLDFPAADTGAFLTTVNTEKCTWSVVNDHLIIADSSGVYSWGGDSSVIAGVFKTIITDIYDDVYTSSYGTHAFDIKTGGDSIWVFHDRPFSGIVWDVTVGDSVPSIAYEYPASGSFTAVSGRTGTCDLSADGTCSWTQPTDWSKSFYSGKYGYWLKIYSTDATGGQPTIASIRIVYDAGTIEDVWSGKFMYPNYAGYHDDGDGVDLDYTGYVTNDNTATYLDTEDMDASDEILIGFPKYTSRIFVDIVPDTGNATTVSSYFKYYNNSWISVTGFSDGTDDLGESGYWAYSPLTTPVKINYIWLGYPLYWFQYTVSAAIDPSVQIYQIRAIPEADPPQGYTAVTNFKNRVWLYDGPEKHIFRYSPTDQPNSWNGDDSFILVAGNKAKIIRTIPFFNEMMVFKDGGEVGLVEGFSRSTFSYERISSTAGPVSKYSGVPIEAGLMTGGDERRSVAMYISPDGFRYCDGLKTPLISQDLKSYFDVNGDKALTAADLDSAFDWIDYENNEYHCDVNGTEFVYNIEYGKWSIFDRGIAINCANSFRITCNGCENENRWVTLAGGADGYVYQLENGTQDHQTAVTYEVEGKDIVPPGAEDKISEFHEILIHAGQTTAADLTVSYALDGATSYTQLSNTVDVGKNGYRFAMPDAKMGLAVKGHSIRWKISTTARLDLYKYTTYYLPETLLIDQSGN